MHRRIIFHEFFYSLFFFNLHRQLFTNAIRQKNIYIMQCNLCSDENIPWKAFDVNRAIYTKSLTSCCICFLDRGQSLINARKHYHLPSWTFFASGEESISTRYWSSRIALIIFTINTHICWGFFVRKIWEVRCNYVHVYKWLN